MSLEWDHSLEVQEQEAYKAAITACMLTISHSIKIENSLIQKIVR